MGFLIPLWWQLWQWLNNSDQQKLHAYISSSKLHYIYLTQVRFHELSCTIYYNSLTAQVIGFCLLSVLYTLLWELLLVGIWGYCSKQKAATTKSCSWTLECYPFVPRWSFCTFATATSSTALVFWRCANLQCTRPWKPGAAWRTRHLAPNSEKKDRREKVTNHLN